MTRRLIEANCQQSDAPLADVLGLLSTLAEAWTGVAAPPNTPAADAPSPWAQPQPQELAASGVSQAWSL